MSDTKEVKDLKQQISAQKKEITVQHKLAEHHHRELEKQKKKTNRLILEHKRLRRLVTQHAATYVGEMKRALSTAILAAFAFLMALSWREYITEVMDTLIFTGSAQSKLASALLVTVISVFGIILITRYLAPPQDVTP